MLIGVDLTETETQPVARAEEPVQPVAAQGARTAPRRCPHPDCAQLNPPGGERCVYCNRPMQTSSDSSADDVAGMAAQAQGEMQARVIRAALAWPWHEETEISGQLTIGREASAPNALTERLKRDFDNVSRRHAELVIRDGALWITDLGSSNGTFVNDTRLAPRQPVRLINGARLRFAASLTATVSIRSA